MIRNFIGLIFCSLFSIGSSSNAMAQHKDSISAALKINGANLMPPVQPDSINYTSQLGTIHANWVSLVFYINGYTSSPDLDYKMQARKWGESEEGLKYNIKCAHEGGLKVMLKPSIWIPGYGWPGDFKLKSEKEWLVWEENYRRYLLNSAELAEAMNVEMLCIGTELKRTLKTRESFWRTLIADIRKVFSGQLTYSANWDNYKSVPFWDELDYIGINAYFPLSTENMPSKKRLKNAWQVYKNQMKQFATNQGKAILFTEFGYRSLDGAVWRQWEVEYASFYEPVNLGVQAVGYAAVFETFWKEDWHAGGFLWYWKAGHPLHGGPNDNTYTPQNKPAQRVIEKSYSGKK